MGGVQNIVTVDMMKISIVISTFVGLLMAFAPMTASAHIVKTDGTIGALLHIYPDDDPIAGQPAIMNFAFTGRTSHLKLAQCDCVLIVNEAGREILRQTVAPGAKNGNSAITIKYAFPKRDVYTVTLQGRPTGGATFQSFKLDYDIRVQREAVEPESSDAVRLASFSLLGIALGVAAVLGARRYLF